MAAGNYVGEMALLSDAPRMGTVRASVATEAIVLDGVRFKQTVARHPTLRASLEERFLDRIRANVQMESQGESGSIISYLLQQGIGEATDVLLIDESLCIRCDNCEKACADTHGGTSRLNREAGPTFAQLHVPTSCRHCEHPHCMKDCPPDAIHRAPNGEVFIQDTCIGCGNCERNCPYNVIQMAPLDPNRRAPSLWSWLLLGAGDGARPRREILRQVDVEGGRQVRHVQRSRRRCCLRACLSNRRRVARFPREIPRLRERDRGLAGAPRCGSTKARTLLSSPRRHCSSSTPACQAPPWSA